jgi:hypothetical protein
MTGIMLVSFLVSYAFFVVAMIAIMAAAAPQPGQPPQGAFFGMLMGLYAVFILFILVVSLAVHSAFFFAFPLVMDRGLSGWDAVKLSLQATRANLSGVVGVLLLAQGLALASSLLCCVGQILELPVNVAMMALAYRQVFPQRDALARFDRYDEPDDDSPRQSGAGETGIQSED